MNRSSPCPCGLGATYSECCEPLHRGALAADAEALMRSRYSAYVLGLEHYLLGSWHPSTRPTALHLAADQKDMKWIGLSVQKHERLDDDNALVEFVARYKVRGRAHRMHEVSRFIREQGRWYYVAAREDA